VANRAANGKPSVNRKRSRSQGIVVGSSVGEELRRGARDRVLVVPERLPFRQRHVRVAAVDAETINHDVVVRDQSRHAAAINADGAAEGMCSVQNIVLEIVPGGIWLAFTGGWNVYARTP